MKLVTVTARRFAIRQGGCQWPPKYRVKRAITVLIAAARRCLKAY
jgi:hypothetical protein